jgi:hypothetical protein
VTVTAARICVNALRAAAVLPLASAVRAAAIASSALSLGCSSRGVAALHEPLVVLLERQRAGAPDHGLVVGEDPDDIGATADLLVHALQRVRFAQLGPVPWRESVERDQILLGCLEQLADLRREGPQTLEHPADALLGLLGARGIEDLRSAAATSPR